MQDSLTSNLIQGHINEDIIEYEIPMITKGIITIKGLSYEIKNNVKN